MADDEATDTTGPDVARATGAPADDADEGASAETADDEATSKGGSGDEQAADGGSSTSDFDVDGAEARLEKVGEEIEEGHRALADMEDDIEPEPEGPPVGEGEGAANAPPG